MTRSILPAVTLRALLRITSRHRASWAIGVATMMLCAINGLLDSASSAGPHERISIADGWTPTAQRDEIRPVFSIEPTAGPGEKPALVISTGDSVGQQGWFQRTFPIEGGKYYQFEAVRKVENVDVPRRSAIVRVVWQDDAGRSVRADVPPGREHDAGAIPLAEPEHPLDAETDRLGWTAIRGTYRAPSKATQAVVELHLQWAPGGRVLWSNINFAETSPPPSRKVRLATIHYVPSGKSTRANCEEYAPLLAEAAKQAVDLVVLGETVPYVRVGKKPHETAETIPGPTTEYFGERAQQHKLHIVLSLYERDGDVVYNTAVLIGPDGTLVGKYRKVCLPHSEVESGVAPGHDYPVFDTRLGKIGLMVCYDGFFPEVARELTNRGAEVIAWPVWGCNPLLAQARACENHVYVVSSTYTDAKSNWMLSAVFDHAGQPIAKASQWGEVAVAEVDLSQRHFWRNNLGDFRSMAQRHRPQPTPEHESQQHLEVVPLFNGRDLTGLKTWLRDTKHEDPRRVFRVTDGLLHITGDGFGYVGTELPHADYRLVVEYRWGQKTDGGKYVRNSGIMLHATGPDGGAGGTWASSIECQLAQGCVGDLIIIRGHDEQGEAIPVQVTTETEQSPDHRRHRWKSGGESKTFPPTRGQLWWSQHDWDFKELLDTRGRNDIESPLGEWTRVECVCEGDRLSVLVNGTLVNQCSHVSPQAGRILLQSEGFELFVRRFELHPLKRRIHENVEQARQ